MKDADRRLVAVAATQRQVFTRQQARVAGLTDSDVHRRVASGFLVAHGPHTLHFGGATLDWRGRLQASLLDLGVGAVVSGRSAAALHGLDGFAEGPVELLVPRGARNRLALGTVASSRTLGSHDVTTVDGLRATSATRTILELVGRVSDRELGNAIDSACRLSLTTPDVLRRRLIQIGRRGRAGVVAFERVMEVGGVQSWLERQFLHLIEGTDLPRPSTQRRYRSGGRLIARVDFDFDPLPVIVEVGGRRGYMSAAERQHQERRRNELQLLGKIIYFFTTEDVTELSAYVLATLGGALNQAA